ncbi:MAG: hypothetical protein WKG07_45610 [Hymenobacter sp.]
MAQVLAAKAALPPSTPKPWSSSQTLPWPPARPHGGRGSVAGLGGGRAGSSAKSPLRARAPASMAGRTVWFRLLAALAHEVETSRYCSVAGGPRNLCPLPPKEGAMHFTVITPSHQRRALLPETVASVRASISAPLDFSLSTSSTRMGPMTAPPPGSPRRPPSLALALRYWLDAAARRPGYARNQLAYHAPADAWLTPLDDDDLLLQRALYSLRRGYYR